MKRKLWMVLIPVCLLCIAAGILICNDHIRLALLDRIACPELPRNPRPGKWYSITPENARCADGSPWRGRIRTGDPDKLMIYLLGGGIVLDDASAARPHSTAGSAAFYYDHDLNVSTRRMQTGIAADLLENPFRDWTILMVPYATGDFHVGTSGIHNGYANFTALMDAAAQVLDAPEQLIITGYSAGGFGAAMLAGDILARFPETRNAVLCVDSALLIHPDWHGLLQDRWHAPEHILKHTQSDNLTLDHLLALHEEYPQLKILFASSVRDGGLAKFQSYIDGGAYQTTPEGGNAYHEHLKTMVRTMQDQLPGAAFYLWDDAGNAMPTGHTILYSSDVFHPFHDQTSVARWIWRALSGEIQSHGLELLKSLH